MANEREKNIIEAKILHAGRINQNAIAKKFGVSRRTIRRWLDYELPEDLQREVEAGGRERREEIVNTAWEIVHLAAAKTLAAIQNEEVKAKDLAVIMGIYVDKILALKSCNAVSSQANENKIVLNFQGPD